jgi:hypothetical protein
MPWQLPWQPIDISDQEAIEFLKTFPKASRFLIDKNLGPELAPTLRNLGYNATDIYTLNLNGRVMKRYSQQHGGSGASYSRRTETLWMIAGFRGTGITRRPSMRVPN